MKRRIAVWGSALALIVAPLGGAWADDEAPPVPVEPPVVVEPREGDPAPEMLPPAEDGELEMIGDASGRPAAIDVVADAVGPQPIIGTRPEQALRSIPGSGTSLDLAEISLTRKPTSLQNAVRGLPGVHIRDEVISGVIPNIGVRGLNPDRSEKMLILEDGVPAGLAPYSVNAAYYVPPFERMARMELLKGSGQILYGPHTVGGVLNLITPDIPCCPSGRVRAMGGSHGYIEGFAEYGHQAGPFGYHVSVLHKSGDGTRDDSTFDIQDIAAKFRYHLSSRTNLTLKLNAYDSEIESTYLGLTQPMFDARSLQNPANDDLLEVSWISGQVTLQHRFRRGLDLLVNVYASDATRNWNRQDFSRNNGFAAPPANTVRSEGDTTVDGGAIYMRSSFGSRDREFFKWGVEPRLIAKHSIMGRKAELHIGGRYHFEKYVNARHNRATFTSNPITRNRDENRVTAYAAFAQETVQVTKQLGISAGLRFESWEGERQFTAANNVPVDFSETTRNDELIPGFGFTYQLPRCMTLFGGVHRGFAPPRISDSIDSNGVDLQLEAEKSWNYELGLRGRPLPWLNTEVTGFYMDFENQVIPANESGGASTADTNAGETEYLGVEAAFRADLLQAMRGTCCKMRCDPSLWLDASYTYVETENVTPNGTFRGNELPYAPNHLLRLGLAYEDPRMGLTVGLGGTYTSEQFTDQANTRAASNDGTRGLLDSYWVFDANLRWRVPRSRMSLLFAVNNIFDERYIASRAPSGIHIGSPRHIFFGLELEL